MDYYQKEFAELADHLSSQIEYDYDKQVEKCRKKMGTKNNDVGEEAMTLAVKRRKKS